MSTPNGINFFEEEYYDFNELIKNKFLEEKYKSIPRSQEKLKGEKHTITKPKVKKVTLSTGENQIIDKHLLMVQVMK